jgi:signal transduction histidine kinase
MAVERRVRRTVSLASIRVRTTVAATAFVAAGLVLGAVGFVAVVDRTLTEEVLTSLRTRAADLTALVEAGLEPSGLVSDGADDEFLQVLDIDGAVVAASGNVRGAPPLASIRPGASTTVEVPNDDELFLAYVRDASSDVHRYRLIIGRTLEPVAEATQLVARLLAFGLPILLILLAGLTWFVVGRSLSPVEQMRREMDAISATELHLRIERPAADDEIGRLADTMNRMLDRLEQASDRQRQLVADTSHELRSPIASIRQQVEVSLAHPAHAAVGPMSASILADTERLQALVDDLLVFARADERRLDLHSGDVDLDDLVLAEGRRLRELTPKEIDLSGVAAARTTGDEGALRRIVRNLADNAVRHATSTIALSVRPVGAWAVLAVDDDGSGIAPTDRTRVFERFVRLDDARGRDTGGAGLGLAIVDELVRAHGGEASVGDSALGGARFEVRLPLAQGD